MNRLWVRLSVIFVATIFILMSFIPLLVFYSPVEIGDSIASISPGVLSDADTAALEQLRESGAWRVVFRKLAILPLILPIIILTLAGVITSILASWFITRPLNKLELATQKIAAGHTGYRLPIEGTYEIQSLGKAFNLMAEEIEEAEVRRQNLLADVSHELRTPLTVLQGNLRGILDDVYEFDKARIAKLYEQTRHLNHLVDDLHDIAQAEAHLLPLNLDTIALEKIVEQVAEIFQPLAEEANIKITVVIHDKLPLIRSDKQRLIQILNNLISNGLRFAKSEIKLTLTRKNEAIVLSIEDDGTGIEEKQLPFIFDRFYRADTSRNRTTGGTGLGLAIVKSLVEALGCDISVQSDINKGTSFRISIPTVSSIIRNSE